ncbi:hypothetical protein HWB05_gp001 [Streptomyces phage BRock]|uniref:Uncharacterized protein n=1 Tax=Streptomyces phage BRock TaxID=1913591 RepID=A0A1J0GVP8_9CAUD|nr:hypothetical protein HWB05_gp001 [Streptomyces phage BRock]APC46263.1 hypothetical protein [Streptomyces phage BRock]
MTLTQTLKGLGISKAMGTMLESFGGTRTVRGNTNTIVALIKRGMVTTAQQGPDGYGNYYTRKGIETTDAIRAYYGLKPLGEHYAWVREFMGEGVEIMGDAPENWTPNFSAPGAAHCFFGCSETTVAVFVTTEGVTEGVCGTHLGRVGLTTHDMPQDVTTAVLTPVDECAGTCPVGTGCEHCDDAYGDILIPGTHALDMGRAGYNRFVGIKESDNGSLFTYGLTTAICNIPGMNGTGKTNMPTMFGDIINIRTSRGIEKYMVERVRYADPKLVLFTPEHAENLSSHTLTDYMVTEAAGTKYECQGCGSIGTHANFAEFVCEYAEPVVCTADVNTCTLTDCEACGMWRTAVESVSTENDDTDGGFMETDDTREIQAYVIEKAQKEFMVNSVVRVKAGSEFPAWSGVVTGHASRLMNGIHTGCAVVMERGGSAQTLPVSALEFDTRDDMSTVAKLTTSAGFNSVSTGTTHHTVDTDGKRWDSFGHVLSKGDMVKLPGKRGYGKVWCTVPGIAIVFVDMGTGEEPVQYDAHSLTAV